MYGNRRYRLYLVLWRLYIQDNIERVIIIGNLIVGISILDTVTVISTTFVTR